MPDRFAASRSRLRRILLLKTFQAILALAVVSVGEVKSADPTDTPDQPANRITKEMPSQEPFVKTTRGYMVPYAARIPGTEITFEMVPVPGRNLDQGERIKPYWIGKYEVTWQEYVEYMKLYEVFKQLEHNKERVVDDASRIDAVTAPTPVYDPSMRFEFVTGPRAPAATMSRYAARQYTKWLSKTSGHQYRLPTEKEWEHACRAGTTTPWSFGADPAIAGDFCVFKGNAGDDGPRQVGSRKPNPWGIHDMHGNVSEWVLTQDLVKDYRTFSGQWTPGRDAYGASRRLMVLKGGNWVQDLQACRSDARRLGGNELWEEDANLPQSPWWLASEEAAGIGFRIISPLENQSADEIEAYWGPDTNEVTADVNMRIKEGRGVLGLVDPELPAVIRRLRDSQRGAAERPPWSHHKN